MLQHVDRNYFTVLGTDLQNMTISRVGLLKQERDKVEEGRGYFTVSPVESHVEYCSHLLTPHLCFLTVLFCAFNFIFTNSAKQLPLLHISRKQTEAYMGPRTSDRILWLQSHRPLPRTTWYLTHVSEALVRLLYIGTHNTNI